jgi:hypothetical protein
MHPHNCTLAGKREIQFGAAVQLQGCVRRALERLIAGDDDPVRASTATTDPDFNVAGRLPFGLVQDPWSGESRPVRIHMGDHGTTPLANDLQDAWSLLTAGLIRQHKRFAGLKPSKRRLDGTRGPRIPFRPLARCAAPGCPRFYFRKDVRHKTCGDDRCSNARYYSTHKSELRPPGRPRYGITIPPPRAKPRPALKHRSDPDSD